MMTGQELAVFTDEGSNINDLSKTFASLYLPLVNIRIEALTINHCNKESTEETKKIVVVAELQSEDYVYRYHWVVVGFRCYIMLDTPWHVEGKPMIEYNTGELKVRNSNLPSSRHSTKFIIVQDVAEKEFESFLLKKARNENLVVCLVRDVNNTAMDNKIIKKDPNNENLLELKTVSILYLPTRCLIAFPRSELSITKLKQRLDQPHSSVGYSDWHLWKALQLRSMWRSYWQKGD